MILEFFNEIHALKTLAKILTSKVATLFWKRTFSLNYMFLDIKFSHISTVDEALG